MVRQNLQFRKRIHFVKCQTKNLETDSFHEIYSNRKIYNINASLFHLKYTFGNSKNLDKLISIC